MKTSSIGLAVALTAAAFNSASAGFAPRPNAIHAGRANPVWHAERFGPRDSGDFHRRRDRQPLLFPIGYIGYQDPIGYQDASASDPTSDVGPLGLGAGAPIINVTLLAPAPNQTYRPPQRYAANAGPKIITIGPHRRSAHFAKMPTIVYGRPVDRTD